MTLADRVDEAQRLIDVTKMAVETIPDVRDASALGALLDVIGHKLSALSETILPGGGK